jgi:hypothetical protein
LWHGSKEHDTGQTGHALSPFAGKTTGIDTLFPVAAFQSCGVRQEGVLAAMWRARVLCVLVRAERKIRLAASANEQGDARGDGAG